MEIFTTPTTKYYDNGQLRFKSVHQDGLIVVTEWFPDGTLLRECTRNMKTLWFVGMRREYSHGCIEIEIPYREDGSGKAHGIQRGYYPEGDICYEHTYENGRLIKKKRYNRGVFPPEDNPTHP